MKPAAVTLAHLGMSDEGPLALVEAAAGAGFAGVGLPLRSGALRPLRMEIVGDAALVRAIRKACRDNGVGIFDVEALVLGHEPPADALHALFETAAELGASRVSCLGHEPAHGAGTLRPGEAPARLARLADMAAGHGLLIAVEFMAFRSVGSLPAAVELIQATGHANLGLVVDALHAHRTGVTPEALAALPAGMVSHLQLCDAPSERPPRDRLAEEARGERLLPGDGVIPLRDFVNALPGGTRLSLEIPVRALAALSVAERARRGAAALSYL